MLKRNRIKKMLGIGICCLFLLGCAKESFLIEKSGSSTVVLEEVVAREDNGVLGQEEGSKENQSTEQKAAADENSNLKEREAQKEENLSMEEQTQIAVHICGAVNQPGVYYLKENQRVYEGILKAGGFREDADEDYLNQALFLEDGMKITVPTKEETEEWKNGSQQAEGFIQEAVSFIKTEEEQGKVDLNTADEALLCTLPGIGKSRAQSIIAYRREHGAFGKAEDVMKVSGIKEAAYEKIKDYVTVSQ